MLHKNENAQQPMSCYKYYTSLIGYTEVIPEEKLVKKWEELEMMS